MKMVGTYLKKLRDRSGILLSATLSLSPSSLGRSLPCNRHPSPSAAEAHSLTVMGLGHSRPGSMCRVMWGEGKAGGAWQWEMGTWGRVEACGTGV